MFNKKYKKNVHSALNTILDSIMFLFNEMSVLNKKIES